MSTPMPNLTRGLIKSFWDRVASSLYSVSTLQNILLHMLMKPYTWSLTLLSSTNGRITVSIPLMSVEIIFWLHSSIVFDTKFRGIATLLASSSANFSAHSCVRSSNRRRLAPPLFCGLSSAMPPSSFSYIFLQKGEQWIHIGIALSQIHTLYSIKNTSSLRFLGFFILSQHLLICLLKM